jgi:hypothetical protein
MYYLETFLIRKTMKIESIKLNPYPKAGKFIVEVEFTTCQEATDFINALEDAKKKQSK